MQNWRPWAGGDPLTQGLDWAARPQVYCLHALTCRPPGTLHASASGKPLLVSGTYGKGRVAVFLGSLYGAPRPGDVPIWAWKEWPTLMQRVLEHLGRAGD